jgi:hypothetical protein
MIEVVLDHQPIRPGFAAAQAGQEFRVVKFHPTRDGLRQCTGSFWLHMRAGRILLLSEGGSG